MNVDYKSILMGRPFQVPMPANPYLGMLQNVISQVQEFKEQYPQVDAGGTLANFGRERARGGVSFAGAANGDRRDGSQTGMTGSVV